MRTRHVGLRKNSRGARQVNKKEVLHRLGGKESRKLPPLHMRAQMQRSLYGQILYFQSDLYMPENQLRFCMIFLGLSCIMVLVQQMVITPFSREKKVAR
mmetsp:Transcript_6046/g.23295  ORF Transcript_6046/g.23295 Transcript_6046/m.23295 type:complete len:99 (+) Transcript_6046:2027-2323(+)